MPLVARELAGHDDVVDAVIDHLAADDTAIVSFARLGALSVRTYPPYVGRHPRTGAEVPVPAKRLTFFRPARAGGDDDEPPISGTELQLTPALEALATDLREALDARYGVPTAVAVPRLGVFRRVHKTERRGRNPQTGEPIVVPARDVLSFRASAVLARRLQGATERPFPDALIDRALRYVAAPTFGQEELFAMLDGLPRRRGVGAVSAPERLPELLDVAHALAHELGDPETFAFGEFTFGEGDDEDFEVDAPPIAYLFSAAPAAPPGTSQKVWALRIADVDEPDPDVVWCASREDLDEAAKPSMRVPLTTWTKLFALETALVLPAHREDWFLARSQAARIRDAVVRAHPALASMAFPASFADEPEDPWLRSLLTVAAW